MNDMMAAFFIFCKAICDIPYHHQIIKNIHEVFPFFMIKDLFYHALNKFYNA